MIDQILNILTLGLKPIYEKHRKFYELICDFRNKLPRPQHTAHRLTYEELESDPILSDLKYITVVDLSKQKTTVSESDIDQFYNELNHFDFRFMLFPNYYKGIIKNLNRFNPKAENRNFDIFIVQQILKDNPSKPLKPIDAFLFNLKWNFKPTSKFYVWILNRSKRNIT